MGGLASYFTNHRTAANFLMVVMLIIGLTAASKIRSQFFPDVIIDTVSVVIDWDGAGPEEIDEGVVSLIDPVLQGVEGVESTSASSRTGRTTLTLTFEPDWDMARATEDVKAAVEGVKTLPEGVDTPVVSRGVWKDKVTEVIIYGPLAAEQLGQIGDDLIARLYRQGISRVAINGVAAPQIEVTLPELSRLRHDISLKQVADLIRSQGDSRPGGDLAGDTARLAIGSDVHQADALRNLPVDTATDGSKIYLRNIADVQIKGSDAGRAYFYGEHPAILIRVDRSSQGDAIAIQRQVEQVVDDMLLSTAPGVQMRLINARAEDITDRLDILLENGLQGFVLVLIILFLFLSARTAIWVAAGIPVSMFAAIALMYASGHTINMMSLFALIITLGIVVDDAIVVAEHADYRARHLGEAPNLAPVNAVQRMLGPVLSSTTTTILAFTALFFIGGAFGSLIGDIPFVVVAVLIASSIESFLILPNHMRHALEAGMTARWYDKPSEMFNRGFDWVREVIFDPLITWTLKLRYLVVCLMIYLLAVSSSAVIKGSVPWQFFTPPESGSISGNFALLSGASREDSVTMMRELQRAVDVVAADFEERYGIYPLEHALAQVGGTTSKGVPDQESIDADLLGAIDIGLIDADQRDFTAFDFVRELQQQVKRPTELAVLSFRSQGMGPGGDSLAVNLYGSDSIRLKQASTELISALEQYPEVTGLQDSLSYSKDELTLTLTPLGESLGFTTEGIASDLFVALNGITALQYPVGNRTAEVRVISPENELRGTVLGTRLMRAPSGEYVPLEELVNFSSAPSFASVARENGRRFVSVTGNLSEDNPERAAEIALLLREQLLPTLASHYDLDWELSGLALQEDDFLNEALLGFVLCIVGIYLVLGWVFESWFRPLVVMAVIPFGLIGTVVGHAQFDLALSLFTLIGLIGMSGIIINDAIVLVTTVDEIAQRQPMFQAAVDAAKNRIRPILLTTLTTVLGLAPLMYESSRQSLFLKPTVVTLVYGLSFGFIVVLMLVPALLLIQEDCASAWRSLKHLISDRRIKPSLRVTFATPLALISLVTLYLVGSLSFGAGVAAPVLVLQQYLPEVSITSLTLLLTLVIALMITAITAVIVRFIRSPTDA